MAELSTNWKIRVARLVKLPLLNYLMQWAIRLIVPRHRVGVVLVLLDESDRVLMLNHVFHPYDPWGLPGGWLNRQEAPAEGVLRELKEETGLTAVIQTIIMANKKPGHTQLDIAYLGRLQSGSLQLSSEIIEAGWYTFDNLPGPMQPFHHSAITAAATYLNHGADSP